jgi:serine/threonine-protein kinase RsbW
MGQDIQVNIIVPNQTQYLSLIGGIGEKIAKEINEYEGDRDALAFNINLALTEAMMNAIKHANSDGPDETVEVRIHIEEDELCIRVYDQGQGFDLDAVPVPDLNHPTEGGLGIFFIRSFMDVVRYEIIEGGNNVLEMRKRLV